MAASCWILLQIRNVSDKGSRGNQNTIHAQQGFFFRKFHHLRENVEKYGTGHRFQYGACALQAGYLRLQAHTQNM